MPESSPNPSAPTRPGRWLSVLSGVVGLVGLVAAVVVVVRSARNVKPGPAPVTLAPPPADTSALRLKHNLKTRLSTQQRRLAKYRTLVSAEQESLAAECDRELASLAQRATRLDSLPGYHARRALYDSLMLDYEHLRGRIRVLARSVAVPEDDSLETELRRLLSE